MKELQPRQLRIYLAGLAITLVAIPVILALSVWMYIWFSNVRRRRLYGSTVLALIG